MGLARGGDCGSTSPRSLDELAQLRTHTAHYSPVMNCTFVDQFIRHSASKVLRGSLLVSATSRVNCLSHLREAIASAVYRPCL
jgi:hypothetical protein